MDTPEVAGDTIQAGDPEVTTKGYDFATAPELPEVLTAGVAAEEPPEDDESGESIDHPAKIMRIGNMLKQLLAEVRSAELDEATRQRLRDIYATSITEIGSALSVELRDELSRLASPFDQSGLPSATELQIAKAQLVGWLEGLIQGMQAMLVAQQITARQQLQSMRGELPPGLDPHHRGAGDADAGHGTYL